ncbi:MAG: hypothetical protein SWH54_01215 [Thermodesulfobacteriota bacterium]|nr:hypothetical protein [Thermodesulfobacteriota bacterium]
MTDKNNEFCGQHSGHEAKLKELCKFKDRMTDPGGTIDNIKQTLNSKIGKGLLITFTILILGLITTLYGLNYRTQHQILDQMSTIKTDIAVIKEKIK